MQFDRAYILYEAKMEVLAKTREKVRIDLSNNLKRYRKLHGWDQHDLAAATELSKEGIAGYEQMKRFPKPRELDTIAAALKCESWELIKPPNAQEKQHFAVEALLEKIEQQQKSIRDLQAKLAKAMEQSSKDSALLQIPVVKAVIELLNDERKLGALTAFLESSGGKSSLNATDKAKKVKKDLA
jgi:transcriptional regulator with XRE-family HTH domain